jgi:uncharacterized protein YndB with AHSA1/START domain
MAQEMPAPPDRAAAADAVPAADAATGAGAVEAGPQTGDATDGDAGTADSAGARPGVVTRTVDVGADLDDVWRAVTDPAERSLWLDDPDALARRVRVDESTPGHRLVWTWWHPGDEGQASTVSVVLRPADGGGTRVVVTESLRAPGAPVVSAQAVRSTPAAVARRRRSWLRCASDRWDSRLLGLELLFVAARAGVA